MTGGVDDLGPRGGDFDSELDEDGSGESSFACTLVLIV